MSILVGLLIGLMTLQYFSLHTIISDTSSDRTYSTATATKASASFFPTSFCSEVEVTGDAEAVAYLRGGIR